MSDTDSENDLRVTLDEMEQVLSSLKDDLVRDVCTIIDPPIVRYYRKSTKELVAWYSVEEGDERLPESERFNKYMVNEKFAKNILRCEEKGLKITGEKPNISIVHLEKEEYESLLKALSDPRTVVIRN